MNQAAPKPAPKNSGATATPMMQQYLAIKQSYGDCLLFYRMGDFYELFFDDAIEASRILDIALTKRGKHDNDDIAMCGVPHHSYEPYLHKLIKAGYKVAICEQMESPEEAKKRGYKAVVKREVVRIVTPGTLVEDALLEAKESNYLAAIAKTANDLALAWIDMSTGAFYTSETSLTNLHCDLARLAAKEVIISDKFFKETQETAKLNEYQQTLTPQAHNVFDVLRCEKRIKQFYGIASLNGFGQLSRAQISACGALVEYVDLTQKGALPRLQPPKTFINDHFISIDPATRRNLEINTTLAGEKRGSLLAIMDHTTTSAGGRLLHHWLSSPLAQAQAINARLDAVQCFTEVEQLREHLRQTLAHIPDMERALSRICLGKGAPRDLAMIRDGLSGALTLSEVLECSTLSYPDYLLQSMRGLGSHDALLGLLSQSLIAEPTMLAREGGFISQGYHPKLDELRHLRDNAKDSIARLQDNYRKLTNITTLKISRNNVLGYFVEVTPTHADKITDEQFIHCQTLANAVRYTTEALKQLESDILNAKDQSQKLELYLFEQLVESMTQKADDIALCAQSIATIDVVTGLAQLAIKRGYHRPHIDHSLAFDISGGRHPVVEANINGELDGQFIANDCHLSSDQRVWLLTGPNMAGKSTFLRQNALIALMAQIGSFVPADEAHIGVVDALFSRVGASDDLARGRSTFMVEMVETATILHQATKRSLVILDEIGRGTATYDGLSIAWATVEHLHHVSGCRSLFATHYHELTSLTQSLESLTAYSMQVKEWQDDIVFLHQVAKGATDRSYGIHVAKLAGIPQSVTKRAQEVLNVLQQSESSTAAAKLSNALPLFANNNSETSSHTQSTHPLEEAILQLAIDELSPKEALDTLYQLKAMVSETS